MPVEEQRNDDHFVTLHWDEIRECMILNSGKY